MTVIKSARDTRRRDFGTHAPCRRVTTRSPSFTRRSSSFDPDPDPDGDKNPQRSSGEITVRHKHTHTRRLIRSVDKNPQRSSGELTCETRVA